VEWDCLLQISGPEMPEQGRCFFIDTKFWDNSMCTQKVGLWMADGVWTLSYWNERHNLRYI
jgi:hypothetical protein